MENKLKKILIVEEDQSLSVPLTEKFKNEGFDVLVASDGVEGLEIVRKEKPDLVLIDILLPKMDGISMAEKINELGFGTLMIFLTNLSDPAHISDAVQVDVTDYLVKSDWSINDIVNRVKQKLDIK